MTQNLVEGHAQNRLIDSIKTTYVFYRTSLVAQQVKNSPAMHETQEL